MDARDFFFKVRHDEQLEWEGSRVAESKDEDVVLVGCPSKRLHFAMGLDTIKQHSWSELRPMLAGYRSAKVMTHVTRIVGYYSQLNNWNRSKKQELLDRHIGNYILPGDGHAKSDKEASVARVVEVLGMRPRVQKAAVDGKSEVLLDGVSSSQQPSDGDMPSLPQEAPCAIVAAE
jgi:hypothetical protein